MNIIARITSKIRRTFDNIDKINGYEQTISNLVNINNLLTISIHNLSLEIDQIKINTGKLLSKSNNKRIPKIIKNIQLSEFKVFSQWGDDGIIQFLTNYLDIKKKIFIEFGVESYREANTHFLLINNNWSGLIMDGSAENIEYIKHEEIYWQYDLIAKNIFITKDNINNIIKSANISGEIGLLHIDIDGNDYWVWKEILIISPIIVIMEYNSVFGNFHHWTVPYDSNFQRTKKHYSNLYFGSSLLSLCDLAKEKGYIFIGCNSNGNNAYFIRKDKAKKLAPCSPEKYFVESKFRESRDKNGKLTYLSGINRLKVIRSMPIYDTQRHIIQKIKEYE